MRKLSVIAVGCLAILVLGCSTKTHFHMPKGTALFFPELNKVYSSDECDQFKVRPFFWSEADGLRYCLIKDGRIEHEGKITMTLRPVSFIWPPFAMFYWPIGFRYSCYDLTHGKVQPCVPAQLLRKIKSSSS